jgi:hypothetical protein
VTVRARVAGTAVALALAGCTTLAGSVVLARTPASPTAHAPGVTGLCTGAPDYYAIDLVPTRRVPGTGAAEGSAQVMFARSPFGIAVSPEGSYQQALDIRVTGLRARADGAFVVWAATSDLEQAARLGALDLSPNVRTEARLQATVDWNKFLVIVSFESRTATEIATEAGADRWQGPIVMRGMSRSGMMHTMAGHGPFELEPCIKYGYR